MYAIINAQGVKVGRKASEVKRRIKSVDYPECKEGIYGFMDKSGAIVFWVTYKMVRSGNNIRVVGTQSNPK
jgi:hypothetical protein